ncbi:Macrolide export ATP-binding/permease protein MacB [Serratia fonticola]|uniref:Macrolide export ATP-binding/permease protein MacB n=1 Tax=Serratia fonticola TaxID=47917 RepID=A0A4U9UI50_SERFO|nr:Macrolide export ATP-binding/permease protein MacB [Serratia fonticola]
MQTVAVLKNVSLSIQPGEMVAIVGASGSGKSTLMNIIGCLDKPTEGEMQIKGISTQLASSEQLAELRSQYIGFIFQRYHLMPYLSASENVAIPALYTAMPAAERQTRAEYLLTRLGLQQRMNYKPAQLSGGQQQRVSIARALMNGAEIILADEPTGALDRASGPGVDGNPALPAPLGAHHHYRHPTIGMSPTRRSVLLKSATVKLLPIGAMKRSRTENPARITGGRCHRTHAVLAERTRGDQDGLACADGAPCQSLPVDVGHHYRCLFRGVVNGGG